MLRAWFGGKPAGADCDFEGGTEDLPTCALGSEDGLLAECSSIVALHPDEATGVAVDFAVSRQLPFVVVPCCVFARLFTERHLSSGEVVRTRPELIEYLRSRHPAIQSTILPFEGANVALWATF